MALSKALRHAGEPEPKKQETSSPEEVVEDGKIYFLYRPRVGFKEAKSLSDVQRFFLVRSYLVSGHCLWLKNGKHNIHF